MKHANFVRIRDSRMPKALKAIELLGHLASHNYESSIEENHDLVDQLQKQVDEVAGAFGVVPEPEPAPVPIPVATVNSPRTFDQGELQLQDGEGAYLITVGPQIGAAMEAISDGNHDLAYDYLKNLMRS